MIVQSTHAIDAFRLHQLPNSSWVLLCQGWLWFAVDWNGLPLSRVKLTLRVPGIPGDQEIVEKGVPTPSLVQHFGERAARSGFEIAIPVTDPDLPYRESRLIIDPGLGWTTSIDIGKQLQGRIQSPEERQAEIDLVKQFESFGNNCEFGWVQRRVGFERLGLLRWVGSFDNRKLAALVDAKFEDFGRPDDLAFSLHGTEWMATSRRYGLYLHTWKHTHEVPEEEQIRDMFSTSLVYLSQMMLELIEDGARIFIRRIRSYDDMDGVDELHRAMRRHGPATMVWVTEADDDHTHGTVERLAEGFFRAWHRSLKDTGELPHVNKEDWLTLLSNAKNAIDEERRAVRPDAGPSTQRALAYAT